MPYKVLKPIPTDDGQTIESGAIVDADGWRNLRQLVNGRFLVEVLSAADSPEPVSQPKVSGTRPSAKK